MSFIEDVLGVRLTSRDKHTLHGHLGHHFSKTEEVPFNEFIRALRTMPIKETAEKYGVHAKLVSEWSSQLGMHPRQRTLRTDDIPFNEMIRRLSKATHREVAEQYGIHVDTLRSRLYTIGMHKQYQRGWTSRLPFNTFIRLYQETESTIKLTDRLIPMVPDLSPMQLYHVSLDSIHALGLKPKGVSWRSDYKRLSTIKNIRRSIARKCYQGNHAAVCYVLNVWEQQMDLLITYEQGRQMRTSRTETYQDTFRFLLYADNYIELYQDMNLVICQTHRSRVESLSPCTGHGREDACGITTFRCVQLITMNKSEHLFEEEEDVWKTIEWWSSDEVEGRTNESTSQKTSLLS